MNKDLIIDQLTVENRELRERMSKILNVIQEVDIDSLTELQALNIIEEIASED